MSKKKSSATYAVATAWLTLMSIVCPGGLLFCNWLSQQPDNNATGGLAVFLAGVLAIVCVLVWGISFAWFSSSRPKS